MPTLLTSEQLSFYETNGYLHAPAVIPTDLLDLMKTVLSRWADNTINAWQTEGLIHDPRADLDFQHRLAHLWEAAGRPEYIRSPRRDLVSREMFDILIHPKLLALAQDLLDTPEISVHGIFNARPKLPDQIWTQTPWHQDAQYYRDAEQVHVTSIWMPLQPDRTQQLPASRPRPRTRTPPQGWNDPGNRLSGLAPKCEQPSKASQSKCNPATPSASPRSPPTAPSQPLRQVRWSIDVRYDPPPRPPQPAKNRAFRPQPQRSQRRTHL